MEKIRISYENTNDKSINFRWESGNQYLVLRNGLNTDEVRVLRMPEQVVNGGKQTVEFDVKDGALFKERLELFFGEWIKFG